MNMLFGVLLATGSALFVFALFWLIPEKAWQQLPEEVLKWRSAVRNSLTAAIFLVILATNFGTYGPRHKLDNATYSPTIDVHPVNTGEPWSDTEDRRGKGDELLQEIPVRPKITDAKDESDGDELADTEGG